MSSATEGAPIVSRNLGTSLSVSRKQLLDIGDVVGLDRAEVGILAGVVVVGGGQAERELQGVALQVGGGRPDRLDGVLVAALVVGRLEGRLLAVAVGMADPAGDLEPLALLLGAEAVRQAVARQHRVDGRRHRGEVLVAVVRPRPPLRFDVKSTFRFLTIGPSSPLARAMALSNACLARRSSTRSFIAIRRSNLSISTETSRAARSIIARIGSGAPGAGLGGSWLSPGRTAASD